MRRFLGPKGSVSRVVIESQALKSNMLGDPSGRATGVRWSARTSFAACQAGSSVTIDGVVTIDQGRLAFS